MNDIPDWWEALILGVASWRVFHLLAYDDLTDRIRRYVTKLRTDWRKEGDATGQNYRERLGSFIECPYCLGFWVVLGWWVAWLIFPRGTLVVAVPLFLSAILVAAHKFLAD